MSEVTREEFDELRRQVSENTARLHAGDITLAKLDLRLKGIEDKQTEIGDQQREIAAGVKALQEKPAKKWESISAAVLQWVVTALLAYIAVKIGLA